MKRMAMVVAVLMLGACGGEEDKCVLQRLSVNCCQPQDGSKAVCFTSGDRPGCGDAVIESVTWMGFCPEAPAVAQATP